MLVRLNTINELWSFDEWANDTILRCMSGLSDEQLDRPFDMGNGSLRKTIQHIYGAARIWAERWKIPEAASYPKGQDLPAMSDLVSYMNRLSAQRKTRMTALTDTALDQATHYTNWKGEPSTHKLGLLMLHVCNHGVHHRAQAVNMLRHLGAPVPKPGPDYIFKKLAEPDSPPPPLDRDTLRTYFTYADWAAERICKAAAALPDAHLDRPFEMGMGTLRGTLVHIYDAEQWWLDNWHGNHRGLKTPSEPMPIAALLQRSTTSAAQRNEFLAAQSDADLTRIVTARPRPDITRTFPLGVTMLQLCCHGTHHRAQARNMLRHLGATPPDSDMIFWIMETTGGN